ncbi:MAG: hypothetical protein IID40_01095 [Planctomycetes bacterium]|nr:hypothetical protein [Planctomycetota bacterium]
MFGQRSAKLSGLALLVCLSCSLIGCQNQGSGGGPTELPNSVVVYSDPQDPERQGSNVRDANNDDDSFVLIGSNGKVQFMPTPTVCNDCSVTGATITLDGDQLIDIRFGLAPDGTGSRRPFLVDRTSGNFIQLVGGGSSSVTFQVTETVFEEPDDSTDDLADEAGTIDNPAAAADTGGTGGIIGQFCGATGAMLPLILLGMLALRFSARRRQQLRQDRRLA